MIEVLMQPIDYLADKYGFLSLAVIALIPFCYWGLITLEVKALKIIKDIDEDPLDKTKAIRSRFLRTFEKIIAIIIKIIKFGLVGFAVIGAGFIVLLAFTIILSILTY